MLADGSPTHISRKISCGLANQRTKTTTRFHASGASVLEGQSVHFDHNAMSATAMGPEGDCPFLEWPGLEADGCLEHSISIFKPWRLRKPRGGSSVVVDATVDVERLAGDESRQV